MTRQAFEARPSRRAFESRPLPERLAARLRRRLAALHAQEPFSPVDARGAARRVAGVLDGMGVDGVTYRGGLVLSGVEVDHLWLAVDGRVLDAAFPLFVDDFVVALRGWVAGDRPEDDLLAAAAGTGVEERVLGCFPALARYVGAPVWRVRGAG